MSETPIDSLFTDDKIIRKIKARLPHLFYLAQIDSSRAGKIGMQIGSMRENVLVALLMYQFGIENVNVDIPITKTEIDVIVSGSPISIKTVSIKTRTNFGGIKAVWTVDAAKVREFIMNYRPSAHILLVQVNFGGTGIFSLIPLSVQKEILSQTGNDNYLKPPKEGTNPRGVEFTQNAMNRLISHPDTKKFEIEWIRPTVEYNIYKRWIDYWTEEN